MKKATHIGVDTKLIIIKHIMQIAAQHEHVLNGVDFRITTDCVEKRIVTDEVMVPFVNPLKRKKKVLAK